MSDTPLATVDQLAAYMALPLVSTDPAALLYLSAASGTVRDYLQQELTVVAGDVFLADPIDGAYVFLPEHPVTAVSLVELYDDTVTPGVWSTADPSTYTVSKRLGIIAGKPGCGVQWPTDPETWRVTYNHGFATLPDSLLGVVLGVAARAYSSPASIETERIGGYQVKYAVEGEGFTAIEKKALNRYRWPRIA
jgi:hypothetical protein